MENKIILVNVADPTKPQVKPEMYYVSDPHALVDFIISHPFCVLTTTYVDLLDSVSDNG